MQGSLKQRLRGRDNVLGCFMTMPSPALIEVAGYAGFDFLVLDTEHGVAGVETLEHLLRAASAVGVPAIVRTVGSTPGEILRALDAGAGGILVPHVVTAAQTRDIVAAAFYPPIGRRGFSASTRAGHHGFLSAREHIERTNSDIVVMVQIEDAEALADVDGIVATPHLDGVFLGPADMAMSLGHPGELSHPEVLAAGRRVADACRAAGIAASTFARDTAEVASVRANGFSAGILSSVTLITTAFGPAVRAVRALS